MSMQFASATDWQPRTPRTSGASRSDRRDDFLQRDRASRRRQLGRVVDSEHAQDLRRARLGWNDQDFDQE